MSAVLVYCKWTLNQDDDDDDEVKSTEVTSLVAVHRSHRHKFEQRGYVSLLSVCVCVGGGREIA